MENLPISNAVLNFLQQTDTPSFEGVSDYTKSIMSKMENGLILTDNGKRYSDSTLRLYKSFLKYFEMFENQLGRKLLFTDMGFKFGEAFNIFLTEKDLKINSINAILKKFKAIMGRAHKDGISLWSGSGTPNNSEKSTEIYLSIKELSAMQKCDLTPSKRKILDVFIIQCFTGMRYSTLAKFLMNPFAYIKEFEGTSYIEIFADKVDDDSCIPLGDTVIEILKRHGGKLKPTSLEMMNRTIKDIAELAEINTPVVTRTIRNGEMIESFVPKYKMVSSHTARRSFISNISQERDIKDNEIMAITGHASVESMKVYNRSSKFEIILPILKNKFFNKQI